MDSLLAMILVSTFQRSVLVRQFFMNPDFKNKRYKIWVRGDPSLPENYRCECSISPIKRPCQRIDVAWMVAHQLATLWKMKQTRAGKKKEKKAKKWARKFWKLKW